MRRALALGMSLALAVLAGCGTTSNMAPVVDLNPSNSASSQNRSASSAAGHTAVQSAHDAQTAGHVVRKGDTLYSIALEHGLDYRDLAKWNHLTDINHIQVGQTLQLSSGATQDASTQVASVQAAPLRVEPVNAQAMGAITAIDQPKAVKLPYSPAAVAQLEQSDAASVAASSSGGTSAVAVVATPNVAAAGNAATGEESLDWVWPADGPVVGNYNGTGADGKGIDIGGTRGQPVLAAASGKVVYSGSGLHGYGKMVIIKHNAEFLTAYAHNQDVLVKEGEQVSRGQKIAEMGDSDASQVELHFEIRKMGKPVDPLNYLPKNPAIKNSP